ncbi:uncharacterized protein YfkK (UPF0435 family) [Psychrobacter sp. PL15]|uniref:hypothetical protein n=1 Tax=Psychrobacter sp. PL15 TaxID=3071719 RepID=UPI002E01C777|nr:uncharacterized protein YfkK (UPF0435 family) [Psychrobacter sp. PL15]
MYHEKLIENIIVKISECKEKIQVINESEFEKLKEAYNSNDYCFSYSILDMQYHFSPEALEKWGALVQQISNQVFRDQFSLSYINKELRKYFHENYEDFNSKNLNKFLSESKENASDLLFYIPLYGIQLNNKELNIGNFSLKTIETVKEEISELVPELNLAVMLDTTISPNQVLLVNNYQTDSEKALDITLTQTNRFIDILNWKFSQLPQPTSDMKYIISLQSPKNINLTYFSLRNKESITTSHKNIFSVVPLDLNIDAVEKYICDDESLWLVELISQEKINDYYDAILKSIHWFSQFWVEQQNDNKLLYLAISLEALLSEKVATSSSISDRVAFILGEDQVSRLRLRDLSKKLYDLRSDIAHGNKTNVVEEQSLHELEIITRKVIEYALSNRGTFDSLKNFKKSIDEKKYQ